VLWLHHDTELCLQQVDKYFKMKPGSIGDLDFYLGATLRAKRLSNGALAWNMSSSKYIQVAVQNIKDYENMTCPVVKVCPSMPLDPFHLGMFQNWIHQLSSMIKMCHSINCKSVYCIGVLS
jgi:hypothetical protein